MCFRPIGRAKIGERRNGHNMFRGAMRQIEGLHWIQSNQGVPPPAPFLRWAGGKQRLAPLLHAAMPDPSGYQTYREPFLGAGALFFKALPSRAVLSDANADLIDCFKSIQEDPRRVHEHLAVYAARNSREFYYEVRAQSSKELGRYQRAARFVYLNKAAFNGLYRVNRRGEFNVPYGPSPKGPAIPSLERLAAASRALDRADLLVGDFQDALKDSGPSDFVYLDPPYPPRNETAFFRHYTADRFAWEDQERVARVAGELDEKGCLVMISNVNRAVVKKLYRRFRIRRLNVRRWVGANGDRSRVGEIIATNY